MYQLAKITRTLLIGSFTLWLAACVSTGEETVESQSLHQHTQALAEQLFANGIRPSRVAVGSFVPTDELRQQGAGEDRIMARQIQESLITAATQQGAQITEYRTSRQLRLQDSQELMLTRELNDLANRQQLDYFLTGTYSEVQGGLLVNARLIHLRDSSVSAAATHFFPWTTLQGPGQRSEMRAGALYRHPATGDSE
ncbi:hypothetical protein CWE09_07110 [Aliidiomarina minuta]|uniref:FlgO domain-containing protein n=1 Tax=Aliidiomarina minuta TaxID=880057 RepID=A0A432W8S1_9GAMM|nr:FlgO family outer membrane protein [Aliidiomarina minuta]RUO26469.1 hypothetical protein CWE09_07110 [Aliidiomarina minuta]